MNKLCRINNYPIETGCGGESCDILLQGIEGEDQPILDRCQVVKQEIRKPLFSNFIPEVVGRVSFAAIRG